MSNSEHELQETTATITAIHADRTSKNGTPYCSIELSGFDGEWFFLWDGDFKEDVEQHQEIYKNTEVTVLYRDKEDEPDSHFYNVEKLWPVSQEKCQALLQLKKNSNSPNPDQNPDLPPEIEP